MRDLTRAAERLRQVRQAHERFLALWATDCLMDRRDALEQVARDTHRQQDGAAPAGRHMRLYRGSILEE